MGDSILIPPQTFIEDKSPFKYLGVIFTSTGIALKENLKNIEDSIIFSLSKWTNRIILIKGKVIITRSLLYSKLYYLSNIIPFTTKYLDNLCQKINKWVWGNKLPPVKLSRLYENIKQGGLSLGNIRYQTYNILAKKVLKVFLPTKQWEQGQLEN